MSWFITVGLISTFVQGILLFSLTTTGMSIPLATPIAVLLSALVNFSLNYAVTWQDRFVALTPAQRHRWFVPLFLVFAITTPTLWLKILGITLVHGLFGGPLLLIWTLSEIIGGVVNYVSSDRITFGLMAGVTRRVPLLPSGIDTAQTFAAAWRAMRPEQWVKNVFVLAAAPFALAAGAPDRLIPLSTATLAFCAASSSVYLVNDYLDRDRDRQHPIKRFRPIASGVLGAATALNLSVALMTSALALGYLTHADIAVFVAIYLVASHAYSFRTKHVPYLDLLMVGSLYGLRVAAGFTACGFDARTAWPWVLAATLLGIAVVTGKRRGEWRMLRGRPSVTRPVLNGYSPQALPRIYTTVSSATVLVAAIAMARITPLAVLASGLIAIGFIRFWTAVEGDVHDRDPQELLSADRPLCLLIAGYAGLLAVLLIIAP